MQRLDEIRPIGDQIGPRVPTASLKRKQPPDPKHPESIPVHRPKHRAERRLPDTRDASGSPCAQRSVCAEEGDRSAATPVPDEQIRCAAAHRLSTAPRLFEMNEERPDRHLLRKLRWRRHSQTPCQVQKMSRPIHRRVMHHRAVVRDAMRPSRLRAHRAGSGGQPAVPL